MTTVTLFCENGNPVGFHVEGHSGYGEAGGDIVCASISSAVMLVINGVFYVAKATGTFEVEEEKALIHFRLDEPFLQDSVCLALLKAFQMHMEALGEEFQEYVSVQIQGGAQS
ncbi:MAG: ribosomal-processing cysteine protease Prp [Eubacteriales bacterium]|jgi:uncharacterized protein YsxB (DUF464 family)